MKFGTINKEAIFSTGGCFPVIRELIRIQGHLFLTHNPSELILTHYVISEKGSGIHWKPHQS